MGMELPIVAGENVQMCPAYGFVGKDPEAYVGCALLEQPCSRVGRDPQGCGTFTTSQSDDLRETARSLGTLNLLLGEGPRASLSRTTTRSASKGYHF